MTTVLFICSAAVLLGMLSVTLRMISGPTVFDRILAANSFGTKTVVLILLMGQAMSEASYVDIAILYALINFITTIGFLKYFSYNHLGVE